MKKQSRNTETIYVELLNEGTKCWRPVLAERVNEGLFRIVVEQADGETWAFISGDTVKCKDQVFSDGKSGLVAFEKCP